MTETNMSVTIISLLINAVLIPVIGWGGRRIFHRIAEWDEKYKALTNGVLALLRSNYLQITSIYIEKGALPYSESENLSKMYQSYTALGGNGSLKHIQERVETLRVTR